MWRLAVFMAALLVTDVAAWVALSGSEWLFHAGMVPYLTDASAHHRHSYAAWVSIGSGLFTAGIGILTAIRRRRAAPAEDERLTPLPPASHRPL